MRRLVGVSVVLACLVASSVQPAAASALLSQFAACGASYTPSNPCDHADEEGSSWSGAADADGAGITDNPTPGSGTLLHRGNGYLELDAASGQTWAVVGFEMWQGCLYAWSGGAASGCAPGAVSVQYLAGGTWNTVDACQGFSLCAGTTISGAASTSFCDNDFNACGGSSYHGACGMGATSRGAGSPNCLFASAITSPAWRFGNDADVLHGWVINEVQLYGTAMSTPAAHMTVTPGFQFAKAGGTVTITAKSYDASGVNVTATTTYTVACQLSPVDVQLPLFGSCSSAGVFEAQSGNVFTLTTTTLAVGPPQFNFVLITDSQGNTGTAGVEWTGTSSVFRIGQSPGGPVNVGQSVSFQSYAQDSSGSIFPDTFTVGALTHQSCGAAFEVAPGQAQDAFRMVCSYDAAGTYSPVFTDPNGHTATTTVTVGAASSPSSFPSSCTDPASCLGYVAGQLYQVVQAIEGVAFAVVGGLTSALFVSQVGKSYLDFAPIHLVPTIACRSGEAPTAADGVHCLPFPFAVPFDLGIVLGLLDATPTPPTMTAHLTLAPLHHWSGLDYAFTIDPGVVLTPTVMGWVKGVEYVLFVAALGMATRKFVQMFGVD